ncbi:hypothetical protein ACL1BA_13970, partial [Corynebacterium striatum]
VLRQDAVFHETDHTVLRILIKFSRHVPDFPIYSNGTKPGALHEKGSIHGSQLDKFFPDFMPGAGLEQDAPTLQGSGIAGGNDYTDQVMMATHDRCGVPVVLRRGWYVKRPGFSSASFTALR